jgi:hypothetical protein
MKGRNRKGQLVFEFVIAAVFFFYIVFYVINYLNTTAAVFESDFYTNSLEFKALQASELLLHNGGVWNGSTPLVLGLADEWPVLNSTKIQYLGDYCESDYGDFLRKLEVDSGAGHGIRLEINKTDGNLLDCGKLTGGLFSVRTKRFALSDQNEVLSFSMWAW